MCRRMFFCFAFVMVVFFSSAQSTKPVSIIFDSDMGPDYDDVGAIALLHAFADSGYVKVLATVASTRYQRVAGVFDVLNTYFNRPGIPIGVPHRTGLDIRDPQHWSDSLLAAYPHTIQKNEQVPESVEVYRKVLSQQPDNSVTIVTVGFFTNLADLLKSAGDLYSPLTGAELVQKKVKLLVSMAGTFPAGKEFNVMKDAAASRYVVTHWKTPVIYSGFEIGKKIFSGLPLIQNSNIQNSPVKDVFRISIPLAKQDSAGRMSWDETAVLIAAKGYEPYYTLHKGAMEVAADGSNTWNDKGKNQAYVVEKVPPKVVEHIINTTMMHQPMKKP
ncbi:MAG TPA: nucleoside hydrolase [Agriterribacter sp.]|nr:nucleoside hydrolase [Agriterribacter sp.]